MRPICPVLGIRMWRNVTGPSPNGRLTLSRKTSESNPRKMIPNQSRF